MRRRKSPSSVGEDYFKITYKHGWYSSKGYALEDIIVYQVGLFTTIYRTIFIITLEQVSNRTGLSYLVVRLSSDRRYAYVREVGLEDLEAAVYSSILEEAKIKHIDLAPEYRAAIDLLKVWDLYPT